MTAPFTCRKEAGFVIRAKNDGTDYWRLVHACIKENISQDELRRNYPAHPDIPVSQDGVEAVLTPLVYTNPKRIVFCMNIDGRKFILKRAYMGSIGLRRLFPGLMGTTYFTRIMKLVDTAIRNGCTAIQDCFLVAEKWIAPFHQEVWVLLDYLEGTPLEYVPNLDGKEAKLTTLVEELLRYDLTMDDLAPGNFIDGGDAVRAIDISCRPFTALQKAKMRVKVQQRYGLSLSSPGVIGGILEWVLSLGRYAQSTGNE